jgi:DNA-binding CsgD family transcriptional regulator
MDRTAELRFFTDAAAALAAGRQSVIEVVGATGSGKTSLLAAAVAAMARSGLRIRTGCAAEVERDIPFQVFLHAFGDDERFWDDATVRAAGTPLTVEQFLLCRRGRRRITDRAGAGLVLVLDDLQWADRLSQDLIGHLLRYPVAAPLLLVLAYRPDPDVRWRAGPEVRRLRLGGTALAQLTARQLEIARLAGTGATTRLIARQLSVSPRTVDAHLARIYRLLGVPSRAGLAAVVAHG